jgi:N-acetylglucosaminyl-diphospho-decaprenol L-rhamnosyltransferase
MLHPVPAEAANLAEVDVSVVIVSYHCRDDVVACVESVYGSRPNLRFEVTVIDNGSTDGTRELLEDRVPEARLIPMGTNAGFSKANNVGMAHARGRHVLLLNPDTLVKPGALDLLADWLDAHGTAGVAAPQLLNVDGSDQRTARSFPTPAAALFGRRSPLTRWFPHNRWSTRFLSGSAHTGDEPFRIDWVSGAAMMVPASVISEVGGFDEAFFLFWEDTDWCKRMANAGYDVWCIPQAHVTHDEGGTREHGWAPPVVAHFHRGAYLYWRKHHAPQPWNPLRWLAAGALSGRALLVMARESAHSALRKTARPARSSHSPVPIPQPSR